jgi:hypothetical protein
MADVSNFAGSLRSFLRKIVKLPRNCSKFTTINLTVVSNCIQTPGSMFLNNYFSFLFFRKSNEMIFKIAFYLNLKKKEQIKLKPVEIEPTIFYLLGDCTSAQY